MEIIGLAVLVFIVVKVMKAKGNNKTTVVSTEENHADTPSSVQAGWVTFRQGIDPAIQKGKEAVHDGVTAGKQATKDAKRAAQLAKLAKLREQYERSLAEEEARINEAHQPSTQELELVEAELPNES